MSTQRISWTKIKVEPEVLKKLNEQNDLKGFSQVIIQLFVTIALGVLSYNAFKTQPLWISIPVFYIYATVYSFSGLTAAIHELSHNTVFRTRWLNEMFSIIFSFMSWSDYAIFKLSHSEHHAFTTNHGLDKEVIQPIVYPWYIIIQKFTIDFTRFYISNILNGVPALVRRAFGIINPGREEELIDGNDKKRKKVIRSARITVLAHLALLVFIIFTKEWLLLLLITFAIFFAQWINFILSATQHTGLKADVNDFRLNCRSVKLNPIFGFLYWQMQYHVEHHMYASIPFYNLKKLNAVIKDQLPEQKGLVGAWIEINHALKKQKIDPTYYIKVELPSILDTPT
jgi:fatty acid desaturase